VNQSYILLINFHRIQFRFPDEILRFIIDIRIIILIPSKVTNRPSKMPKSHLNIIIFLQVHEC